jgi:drug/metabolite transporter (DMT)-like permease
MEHGEKVKAYLAFGSVCFFWGTTYLAINVGTKTLPVGLFSGTRFALAGALLLLICRAKGLKLPKGREWLHLLLIGLLLVTFANAMLVWASKWIPSGMTALLVATAPFWMAGMETYSGGGRLSLRGILGIVIGFAGLALLIGPGLQSLDLNHKFLPGVIALQAGCFAWCLGSVLSKYYPVKTHPLVGAASQMLLGGLILIVYGLCAGELINFTFNRATGLAYAYLVVFGSLIGYGSYIYALDKLPASKVSMYAYINPVIAVLLGWFFLNERLDWQILTSMAIIFSGVALVKTAHIKERPENARESNLNDSNLDHLVYEPKD